jgi:phage shock protein A
VIRERNCSGPRTRWPICGARAGALDELLQSGVLEDVGGDTDDIQQELDEAGSAAEVDKELAALNAEIGPGGSPAPPELTGSTGS